MITLDQAVQIAREIETRVEPLGFHVALTGSTLLKGQSEDDVDIAIYPHKADERGLWPVSPFEIASELDENAVHRDHYRQGDCKIVFKIRWKGIPVDLFFVT